MAQRPTPETNQPPEPGESSAQPPTANGFVAASNNLQQNLARLLAVASETDDGNARSLSKTDLATRAGIGRSTLHKLLKPSADGKASNPDLNTLCRLAEAFNVPLPFLLMSGEEWSRLAHVLPTILTALSDPGARHHMGEGVRQTQPRKRSQSSLALARRLNVYEPPGASHGAEPAKPAAPTPYWQNRHVQLDQQRRRAIRTLSALPNYALMDSYFAQTAFTLCTLLGASTPLPDLKP